MAGTAGFNGALGFKSESAWGTGVTVDQFLPFLSESIKNQITQMESKAIRGGRYLQSAILAGTSKISGDINFEFCNVNTSTLLRHMFGTIADSGAGPYLHTASPGPLSSKSMTIQVQRPDVGGTTRAFTYAGCKIMNWELACGGVDEYVTCKLGITAATETTATAAATVAFTSGWQPFRFVDASLTIGGVSQTVVRSFSLTADNALDDSRFRLGSATVKEQNTHDMRSFGGTISADFESLTNYALYTAGTASALVLTLSNGTDSLVVTMNVRFAGETPVIASTDYLEQPLPFKVYHATSDASGITAVLTNTESVST
jgi:hypothetical protein